MYICKILSLRFVIFHYDLPAVLGSSVLYYDLTVTKLRPGPRVTTTYTSAQSPDIIENLEPRSEYEVMVQAVSKHRRGEPSSRLVFMTSNHREQIERSANTGERDVTRCCEAVSVSQECQPLSCKNKRSSRKAAAKYNVSQTSVKSSQAKWPEHTEVGQRRVKAVEELGSLTVLCVAGGEPVPEVSLAVNCLIQRGCYYSPP